MRILCKVDGKDAVIIGSGPGFKRVKDKFEPCTVLLVVIAGQKNLSTVQLSEAELYGTPKRLRKLHKKLLRRTSGVVE